MKTDCALADCIPGLPAFDDITLDAPDNESFAAVLRKVRLQGPGRRHQRCISPSRYSPTVAMPGQSGDLFADHSASTVAEEAQHRTVVYDTILNWADFDQWLERLHKAPLTAIDTGDRFRWTRCAPKSSASLSACSRRSRLHPHCATKARCARATAAGLKCSPASNPGWKTPSTPSWASTPSTTAMCLPTTALRYAGYVPRPCCKAVTLEVHRPPTQRNQPGQAPSGRSGIRYEDLCGKGRPDQLRPGDIERPRHYSCEGLRTRPWTCTWCCGRASGRRPARHLPAGDRQQRNAVQDPGATAC